MAFLLSISTAFVETPCEAAGPEAFSWRNPITAGLPGYGIKDPHILGEGGKWYLVATTMPVPVLGKRGLVLFESDNLIDWRESALLIDRESVPEDAWYRDEWLAPEIHRIGGRYYVTFHCRNNRLRPYKMAGLGIAVADSLEGPYTILNPGAPVYAGHNTSVFVDDDGSVRLFWDKDGRIFGARFDPARAALLTEPREILGPSTLKEHFRFLDAPCVLKRGGTYYMITSSFYAGYIIRVRYLTAPSADGPWTINPAPLMTFIESEADTRLTMPYPPGHSFAPPTQVIFHHHVFEGPGGLDYIAYHSSEKYSEPHLVIEAIEIVDGTMKVTDNKNPEQSVSLP
jgi:beta-xylosidase